jgi:hypothetical protein
LVHPTTIREAASIRQIGAVVESKRENLRAEDLRAWDVLVSEYHLSVADAAVDRGEVPTCPPVATKHAASGRMRCPYCGATVTATRSRRGRQVQIPGHPFALGRTAPARLDA